MHASGETSFFNKVGTALFVMLMAYQCLINYKAILGTVSNLQPTATAKKVQYKALNVLVI